MMLMMFISLLVLHLLCSSVAPACSPSGSIKLISAGSTDGDAGRVEICYNHQRWESINDYQWDDRDARVACAQLGFAREGATAYRNASYDLSLSTASRSMHYSAFSCSGSESRITYCGYQNISQYTHANDAGVKCLYNKPCEPRISSRIHTTTTSASFSWTACSRTRVARTARYLVSCASSQISTSSTSATVCGLSPNKRYTCYVYGIDDLGRLSTGARSTFTSHMTTPSFAPLGFRYTSVSSTSISLTWEPPPMDGKSGTITRYRLTFRCRSYYRCNSTQYHDASGTSYQRSQLYSGKEYIITIRACTADGCGSRVSTLTVILPEEVHNFAINRDRLTVTTATLSWRQQNGEIQYYIIKVNNLNTFRSEGHYIANSTSTSTIINSLHPYHRYSFSIAAFTVAMGPFVSRTIQMPEAVPTGGPQTVNCGVVNLTTLHVSWTEPHHLEQNGPIEQYLVYVWNNDTKELVYSTILKASSGIQVTSLDPYHNYNCSVAAFARGGLGPFTTANVWLTDHANAGVPMNLNLSEIGSDSAIIRWLAPYTRNQNTNAQDYRITIRNEESNRTESVCVRDNSYELTSLHPNYHYTVTVEAICSTTGPNASIDIQTPEAIPSEPPQNLQAITVSTHSVTLKWEAPPLPSQNGAIIGYTVQAFKEDNPWSSNYSQLLLSNELSLTVTNLEDDTTYNFSVAANTSIGAGPFSAPVIAKTKNYALQVGIYTGSTLLVVLVVVIIGLCIVGYRYRSQQKQYISKWPIRCSKRSVNVKDYNINKHWRESTSKDDDEDQTPELPEREYLEDIDFVCKEFDLFFKHKPDLPARMEDDSQDHGKNECGETGENVACSGAQSATVEKSTTESSHYMSLKKAQENSENVYQSLMPKKKPIAYEDAHVKEESNSGSHYQQLILARQESKDIEDSNHYQSLNATVKST